MLDTTNDAEWSRLTRRIGRPELASLERYRRNADRVRAREELDDVLGGWCRGRTLVEIQQQADDAGIGNARLNTPLEVVTHPELTARARWQDVASPAGTIRSLLPPPVMEGDATVMGPVPDLAEHTEKILVELGYSTDDVAALREAGASRARRT